MAPAADRGAGRCAGSQYQVAESAKLIRLLRTGKQMAYPPGSGWMQAAPGQAVRVRSHLSTHGFRHGRNRLGTVPLCDACPAVNKIGFSPKKIRIPLAILKRICYNREKSYALYTKREVDTHEAHHDHQQGKPEGERC